MTELKTLKDLEIAGHDVVREEAIKWVKAFDLKMAWAGYRQQDPFYKSKPERDLTKEEELMLKNIFESSFKVGLMRIHNITEEDLK